MVGSKSGSGKKTSSGTKSQKLAKINGTFEYDHVPSYIEVNGVLYSSSMGCGNKKRAEEELKYTDGAIIVKTVSYWVYRPNIREANERAQLEKEATENSKFAPHAKRILSEKKKETVVL